MKIFSIILFVACVAFTLGCEQHWTGCEGMLRDHDTVCREYGYDTWTQNTDSSGCGWTSIKRLCRRGERVCQWTECEGGLINPQTICDRYGWGEATYTGGDCGIDKMKVLCCTKCTEV